MLKKTNLCCFSPTGGTRHMGELFCQDISEEMTVTDLLKKEEDPGRAECSDPGNSGAAGGQ